MKKVQLVRGMGYSPVLASNPGFGKHGEHERCFFAVPVYEGSDGRFYAALNRGEPVREVYRCDRNPQDGRILNEVAYTAFDPGGTESAPRLEIDFAEEIVSIRPIRHVNAGGRTETIASVSVRYPARGRTDEKLYAVRGGGRRFSLFPYERDGDAYSINEESGTEIDLVPGIEIRLMPMD